MLYTVCVYSSGLNVESTLIVDFFFFLIFTFSKRRAHLEIDVEYY